MAEAGSEGTGRVDGRRLRYRHRREELLQAATDHVLAHGMAQLSLRRVAESAGVSHAALLHHFGTREALVAEIVERVLDRAFTSPELLAGRPEGGPLRALWRHATSGRGEQYVRLFLAITGGALHDEALAGAVGRSVRQRTGLLQAGLVEEGCPPGEAAAVATLVLGTMRGLVQDRFVTGDTARTDAAFEVFVRGVELRVASWRAQRG
ncbi:TetR/AcrR family transcriptional regulator [Kineococcus indalonis]|uniref:TetR/AcrR family transcriptional regulator n=1 Tax=Kineococcus indalonis TaxID=2696566 RepID=UPI001411F33E|nr:TetR/AcrR family transcriptional regulator [Kineococcus indalonis]NAZ88575.1 TetR family transcriptional regulator [Kineococcus indalonis]